ncbi:MAG: hypothetical protein IJT91_05950 [Clostridia bacterium]|nr:hypothetical protein [Clostridia bacterium]
MKNYEQMAERVFARIEEYNAKKQKRLRTGKLILIPVIAVMMIAGMLIGAWKTGAGSKEIIVIESDVTETAETIEPRYDTDVRTSAIETETIEALQSDTAESVSETDESAEQPNETYEYESPAIASVTERDPPAYDDGTQTETEATDRVVAIDTYVPEETDPPEQTENPPDNYNTNSPGNPNGQDTHKPGDTDPDDRTLLEKYNLDVWVSTLHGIPGDYRLQGLYITLDRTNAAAGTPDVIMDCDIEASECHVYGAELQKLQPVYHGSSGLKLVDYYCYVFSKYNPDHPDQYIGVLNDGEQVKVTIRITIGDETETIVVYPTFRLADL